MNHKAKIGAIVEAWRLYQSQLEWRWTEGTYFKWATEWCEYDFSTEEIVFAVSKGVSLSTMIAIHALRDAREEKKHDGLLQRD